MPLLGQGMQIHGSAMRAMRVLLLLLAAPGPVRNGPWRGIAAAGSAAVVQSQAERELAAQSTRRRLAATAAAQRLAELPGSVQAGRPSGEPLRQGGRGISATAAATDVPHGISRHVGGRLAGGLHQAQTCASHRMLYGQIRADLGPWRASGITPAAVAAGQGMCKTAPHQFLCVRIIGGRVYLTSLPSKERHYADESLTQAAYLLELHEAGRGHSLDDLEFALYTGGAQLEGLADRGAALGNDGLVLAPFKRRDNPAALVPNAAAFRCDKDAFDDQLAALQGQGQGQGQGQRRGAHGSASANATGPLPLPWASRAPKLLGRFPAACPLFNGYFAGGSQRPCAALALDSLSARSPDQLDAHKYGVYKYLEPAAYTRRKYAVAVGGSAPSPQQERLMLSGAALLLPESLVAPYYQAALIPWVHYVPVHQLHNGDALEALAQLGADDDWAARVADNAARFASLHLHRQARLCYWRELLGALAGLRRYNVSCNAEPHSRGGGGGGGGSCGVPVEQVIRGVAQAGPRRGCDLLAQLDQLQR